MKCGTLLVTELRITDAMLPIVLVLIVAQCALGASNVGVTLIAAQNAPRPIDNGSPVSGFLVNTLLETVDGGDTNIYILTIQQILEDLANQPDKLSQSLALCQAVSIVGELATGRPGDACVFANVINAYTDSVVSGNKVALNKALAKWLGRVFYDIDAIHRLTQNAVSLRDQSAPRDNCGGGGRSYRFEASWDALFSRVNPFQIGLVNEEYCAAKRLYTAWNERSNVIGAAVTACANDAAVNIFSYALNDVSNLLRTVAYNGNVAQAAPRAKESLARALDQLIN